MRVLAVCVEYGVVASAAFSQTLLLQLLDECNSGAGGKLAGRDIDLVLETVMAGLPISVRYIFYSICLSSGLKAEP